MYLQVNRKWWKETYNTETVTALIYIVLSPGFKVKMHESGNMGHLWIYIREWRGPLPWEEWPHGHLNLSIMATHSSILPGESHGQRNLVGYSPWQRVGHDWSVLAHSMVFKCITTVMYLWVITMVKNTFKTAITKNSHKNWGRSVWSVRIFHSDTFTNHVHPCSCMIMCVNGYSHSPDSNLTEHILFWEENNKCCLYSKVMGETWEGGGCCTHFKGTNWDKPEKASLEEVAGMRVTYSPWLHEREQVDAAPYSKANNIGCLQWGHPELDFCPLEVVCVCPTMCAWERGGNWWVTQTSDSKAMGRQLMAWGCRAEEGPTAHRRVVRLPTAAGARMPGQTHAGSFWARYEWLERSRL